MKVASLVALLPLLALTISLRAALAAPNADTKTSSYSADYDPAAELRRSTMSNTSKSPSVRACTYYNEGSQVIDIARLEIHSRSCESGQSIDSKLPDRSETEIYKVGEPFDTPKRN